MKSSVLGAVQARPTARLGATPPRCHDPAKRSATLRVVTPFMHVAALEASGEYCNFVGLPARIAIRYSPESVTAGAGNLATWGRAEAACTTAHQSAMPPSPASTWP